MTNRRAAAPNDKALKPFVAVKIEIDVMLARLKALSDATSTPTRMRSTGAMLAP